MSEFRETGESRNPFEGCTTGDAPRPVDPDDLTIRESEKTIKENPVQVEVEYLDAPVKSETDKKEYRVIKLPNGLTALLISDLQSTSTDKINKDNEETDGNECRDFAKHTDKGNDNSEDSESKKGVEEKPESDLSYGNINATEMKFPSNEENVALLIPDVQSISINDGIIVKLPRIEEKLAACGLCVGVGNFSDPPEIPGLAHLLEHMVFLGSEKYPQENDCFAFIKKYGGFSNGETASEWTTFHFEIQEKRLLPALDRLAQFLISPLINPDAMTREREIVDIEFHMTYANDDSRRKRIFCSSARTGHPISKFIWGNLVTLRDQVDDDKLHKELHKFRERHYSAHRMTLALQARLPLDTLEQYVKDCFAAVPNNGLPADDFTQYIGAQSFDALNFNRIYKIKPVNNLSEVELTWVLPPLYHLYKSKPYRYVGRVFGHEGRGSLFSYLRKKMWCLDGVCGVSESPFERSSIYAFFKVSLVLTEDGHKHLKEVLDAVFSYIHLMRKSGPQKRIHDEIRLVDEADFRFVDEPYPYHYVQKLAKDMRLYAPRDYITGPRIDPEYNPTAISDCVEALTPDAVNIIIFDKKYNDAGFEKVEPWFKTKYTDTDIPKDWMDQWKEIEPFPDFHLPEPNIFIPDDFSLIPLPENVPEYPRKIHSDGICEIWYRPDPRFRKPECCMYYHFAVPSVSESCQNSVSLDLWISVLQQLLAEEVYPATHAGLVYKCYADEKGITVRVIGFNQKMPLFVSTIITSLADCSKFISRNMFDIVKAQRLMVYHDRLLNPEGVANDVKESTLYEHWGDREMLAALSDLEFDQFRIFAQQLFNRTYIKCLVQGNIEREEVLKIGENCVKILNCRSVSLPKKSPNRVTEIDIGERCCQLKNVSKSDPNSVVTNYYQFGIFTIEISDNTLLLEKIMSEPLINQLRTREQLGYIVNCSCEFKDHTAGFRVNVCTQANKFTTEYIDERIEAFLISFMEILNKMTEEELSSVKSDFAKPKHYTDLNLRDEASSNWGFIELGGSNFVRAEYVNSTTVEDLRKFMKRYMLPGSSRRKLSIQIVGNPGKKDDQSGITSTEEENGTTNYDFVGEDTNDVELPLEYLTDMPNENTNKPAGYYIADIRRYKNSLYIYPADWE